MRSIAAVLATLLFAWTAGGQYPQTANRSKAAVNRTGFPDYVSVRLWYLRPSATLKLGAEPGLGKVRKCAGCSEIGFTALTLRASGSRIQIDGEKSSTMEVHAAGTYQVGAPTLTTVKVDFPIDVRSSEGHLLVTASMPMDEYIAGVLAGETGNFKSDETLKAMAVAARTYALHFGSRHALGGFAFCDSTHCQTLQIAGVSPRLRKIAQSTSGEILWYDGEPAATYYHANCGGDTEDGRFILGNNEPRAPYLKQHSDIYCVRNGASQWRSQISKGDLQRALVAEGMKLPGQLRNVAVSQRTLSGRVEFLTVTGSQPISVPGLTFRAAVGHEIGWDRLKSNWYDVRVDGDQVIFHGRGSGHGVGLCQVGAEIMGEEGHTYSEILAFYYPGTRLGVSAQGTQWQQLNSEDVELFTTRPERDRPLGPMATRVMHEAEEKTGLLYNAPAKLKVYTTVSAFRDATGEPGWVAASTRGSTIRMQPTDVLQDAGTVDSTLRHELLHILVEEHARSGTPLWFREGLVLYLAREDAPAGSGGGGFQNVTALERALRAPATERQMRQAYADALARVSKLIAQNGRETVIRWLQEGLPPGQ